MTRPSATGAAPAATRRGARDRWLVAACAVALAVALVRIVAHDPVTLDVRGDQASFVYSALSLWHGDLSYDAHDQERWVDLGWTSQPRGLFLQARDDGWAFAKPVGYSALLAPFLAAFGSRGITVLGALLVLAYAGCWYFAATLRWRRPTALAVATAATLASHAWFYAFPAHADLFVAVLVGLVGLGCVRARLREETWPLLVAAGAAGLLVTEKIPALLVLAPLLAVAMVGARRRAIPAVILMVAVAGASIAPNLHYSDGASWSAYGGERYYAPNGTPWSGGAPIVRWPTEELLTPSYVWERVSSPSTDMATALLTYGIGQRRGLLTFAPIVPALLAVAAATRWRGRRGDRPPAPPRERTLLAATVLAIAGYVAFYVILFTDDYWGGGQSVGNRYFLQISPLVALVPVLADVGERAARRCAAFAVAWAVAVLGPMQVEADRAFHDHGPQSWVQEQLPEEPQAGSIFPDLAASSPYEGDRAGQVGRLGGAPRRGPPPPRPVSSWR